MVDLNMAAELQRESMRPPGAGPLLMRVPIYALLRRELEFALQNAPRDPKWSRLRQNMYSMD